MAILKFVTAALCLTLSGCLREPTFVDLSDRNVSVHAMLIGGEDSARVLISRPNTNTQFGAPIGVVDAVVHLITAHGPITLTHGGACFSTAVFGVDAPQTDDGCYTAAVPAGIAYGATYELEITVPGRAMIRGSTRVPQMPALHSPVANAEVAFSTQTGIRTSVQVAWSVAEPDSRVTVHMAANVPNCALGFRAEGFGLMPHLVERGSGSIVAEPLIWNCSQPPDRTTGQFVLIAFDDNYNRYLLGFDNSLSAEEASVGLTGAFGVFASGARVAVPVTLVKQ